MSIAKNDSLIIPELNNSKLRRADNGRLSVYDLIRVAGGKKGEREVFNRLCKDYPELVTKCDADYVGEGKARKKTPVATEENCLYILGLLPGACGKSYREKAANLVRRYLKGDANLGMEIMIRDHNKERFERAKKRLLVCETNKQAADLAVKHNAPVAYVHGDRYRGLYQQNATKLREDAGLKKSESPLSAMSTYDLTLNSLANMAALQSDNPNAIYAASNGLRKWHKETTGKTLEPQWENRLLRPDQARKVLNDSQFELPLGI